jgi:gentisate 1,2-dioxygenase
VVLTPNWAWHDHANNTTRPMIWLDGLDAPLVRFLGAAFQEEFSEETQPLSEHRGLTQIKHGAGALRPSWDSQSTRSSPLMHYPWEATRAALHELDGMAGEAPTTG